MIFFSFLFAVVTGTLAWVRWAKRRPILDGIRSTLTLLALLAITAQLAMVPVFYFKPSTAPGFALDPPFTYVLARWSGRISLIALVLAVFSVKGTRILIASTTVLMFFGWFVTIATM